MLLAAFLALTLQWRTVFCQRRLLPRAQRQALGALLVLGRATLSRILWTNGREQHSWSAEYFLHSRAKWDPQALFSPLLPLHGGGEFSARAIPIRFEEVSTVKKPGKRADAQAWEQYRADRQRCNLSQRFVGSVAQLRTALDQAGGESKILVVAGDGSFCNRTALGEIPARTELIVRTRKDAKLCLAAAAGTRRVYAADKFTPEQVRADQSISWHTTKVFYGGKRRKMRYKSLPHVLWQGGGRRRPLRLFVIAPIAYRKRQSARLYYRDPAYLLCTDRTSTPRQLLQIYFDRWQIEVNHREEKDTLGVGQAQLWNPLGVPKQ